MHESAPLAPSDFLACQEQSWFPRSLQAQVARAGIVPAELKPGVLKNDDTSLSQNVPSNARVAAGAFGFLTLSQFFAGPAWASFDVRELASRIFQPNAHIRAPFFQIVPYTLALTQILPVRPVWRIWRDKFR